MNPLCSGGSGEVGACGAGGAGDAASSGAAGGWAPGCPGGGAPGEPTSDGGAPGSAAGGGAPSSSGPAEAGTDAAAITPVARIETKERAALETEYGGRGKDPWGNERVGFTATGAIDRKDFGLVWNQALETGGVLVSDRVDLELEVQGVRAAATKAA